MLTLALLSPVLVFAQAGAGFTDVTSVSKVDIWAWDTDIGGWHGTYVCDFDNDGLEDMFMTSHGIEQLDDTGYNALFKNNGDGTFTNVGFAAGLDGNPHGRHTRELHGASWFDYDRDGDYDIYFPNTDSVNRPPDAYDGFDRLYRNNGDGTFTEVSSSVGPLEENNYSRRGAVVADIEGDGDLDFLYVNAADDDDSKNRIPDSPYRTVYVNNSGTFTLENRGIEYIYWSEGITSLDYDNDGDVDILVANQDDADTVGRLVLWENDGTGNFTDVSASVGLGLDDGLNGSVTTGDYDNDGDLDVYNKDALYENDISGSSTFIDRGPIGPSEENMFFADLDNDGDLDLVSEGIHWNQGGGSWFQNDFGIAPDGARGGTAIDYDNDGDLDIIFNSDDRTAPYLVFYRNDLSNSNHWLKVALTDPSGGIGRPGAKVSIFQAGTSTLLGYREVTTATGFVTGPSPIQHFGLGPETSVDIVVDFIGGTSATLTNVSADQTVTLNESTPDATVSAADTQTANLLIPSTDQYVGGKFVISSTGNRDVTGITIRESGTVDALAHLSNVRLYYELDTTLPYDGASESYGSGETQFGSAVASFTNANGTATFSDSVTMGPAATMVVYVVLDVGSGATNGETIEISIDDPSTDVSVDTGTVGPATAVEIPGTTTLLTATDLTQIHYRWRNDDNTETGFDTGDGADGPLTPSGTFNLNVDPSGARSFADGIAYRIDASSATGTSVDRDSGLDTLSNGIAPGDEVLLINLQGASGDTADVGHYEFLEVQSVSASTITFTTAIQKSYDGTTPGDQFVVVQRVPNYTDVTLDGSDTLTASPWESLGTTPSGTAGYQTGLVVFRATGTVDVQSGASIDVDGLGYRGGPANTGIGGNLEFWRYKGEGYVGGYNVDDWVDGSANSEGGGPGVASGNNNNPTDGMGAGGGGGYGTAGSDGTATSSGWEGLGGGTYGLAALTDLFVGSGGGSGGYDTGSATRDGGAGGDGGGIVYVIADTINVSGSISSDGTPGFDPVDGSGGGGGSGGSILLEAKTTTLGTSFVTASGGAGGIGSQNGGVGGSGRIHIGADTITGTTSPSADTSGTPGGAGATWAAPEDTKLVGQDKLSPIRLRFQVWNNGATSTGPVAYELQFSQTATCAAGSYVTVPTSATDEWQIIGSPYIADGEPTANVPGGLTDAGTTFVPGELKDAGNTTGSITMATDEYTEIEFAVQATTLAIDGADYCFQLYESGSGVLDTYSVYAEVQLSGSGPAVTVSASGTQTASMTIPSVDQYVGGKFLIATSGGPTNVKDITITESGTVDALVDLDDIQLFYELDTTSPYDGASESFGGGELPFGSTVASFNAADGTATFSDSVGIDTSAALVVYVVFDVGPGALDGQTVEIAIDDPSTEVTVASGTVDPATAVGIPGTTTLSDPAPAGAVIYYSVGTDSSALHSGTASATAGTLFLNNPAADNVGVGDEVREGANRYYITGRTSATEFTIQDSSANGGTPGDTNINFGSTTIAIHRAFNSLSAAVTGSADGNHLNTSDLVTGDFQLNWTCYIDDPLDDAVLVDGYTTDLTHNIHIYTPALPSEVGTSQRHSGVAGTGFRLAPVSGAAVTFIPIQIADDFVHITGIELDGSSITNANRIKGIDIVLGTLGTEIDSIIMHDFTSNTASVGDDMRCINAEADLNLSNSIFYGVENNQSGTADSMCVLITAGTSHYIYNNTIFNIKNNNGLYAGGIVANDTTPIVTNNVVLDVISIPNPEGCFLTLGSGSFDAASSNNVSSDATAPGPGSATNQLAFSSYFVDENNGTEDLHLKDDSLNLWGVSGADLDTDPNLPVIEDIDGEARDASTPDIGADEFTVAGCFPTINYRSIGTQSGNLENAGTAFVPLGGTVVTFTGVTLPTNIGLGDRIILEPGGDNQIHYILSRDSDTQVTIEPPTVFDYSSGIGYLIQRAYNTLQAWEDDRDGDLVAQNYREVGVLYDDGTDFGAGVIIDDSVTDSCNFMSLTVAPGHRHDGTAATGATVNGGLVSDVQIQILDDYTEVDWLVVRGSTGPGISVGASNVMLRNFILYWNSYGVRTSGGGTYDFTARNCIVHKSTNHGIMGDGADDQGTIQNCTLYSNSGHGVYAVSSNFFVTNALSIANGGNDIDGSVPCGQQSYNMTSDSTACGTGSQTGLVWTAQFVDIGSGPEDLHLAPTSDAINGGTDLSAFFFDDVDEETRVGTWDVGADEVSYGPGWWNPGWGVRRQIVIDNTGRGELLDFPMLLCLDDTTIDYSRVQDGGEDLRFLDADDATVLSHEIELWDESGTSYVWVRVPQIDAGSDIDFINMYYDNPSAGDGQDAVNVWSNGFQSVYHLHDDFADSSSTNSPGTNNGSVDGTVNRLAGDHQRFDGTSSYIDLDWIPFYGGDLTWEGWYRFTGNVIGTDTVMGIEDRYGGLGDNSELRLGTRDSDLDNIPDVIDAFVRPDANPKYDSTTTPLNAGDGNWHYIALTRNLTTAHFYWDGVEVDFGTVDGGAISFPDPNRAPWGATRATLLLGAQWQTDGADGSLRNQLEGDIDEVRTSLVARSADWLNAQFVSTSCNLATISEEIQATAVELLNFEANAGDEAVELVWETGSEIDNVGFYLYRSESEEGPYELLNETVIPGLGSSPLGATYRYVDSGLVNGTTYFYELEDLESTGVRERHGPVSATPQLGASFPGEDEEDEEAPSDDTRIIYGEPEATSIQVLQVNKRDIVIELLTEGFYATPQEDGSVLLDVPGFLYGNDDEDAPAVPIKQAWVQALAGKKVRIVSVDASDIAAFSLRPSAAQILEPVMTRRGEVRLARRAGNPRRAFRSKGLYPEKPAQLVSVAFQEEIKKALVELAPLRWDAQTGKLLLAKRLVVKLRFQGRANGELSLGGAKGKKHRRHIEARKVVAQLVTEQPGLYGVAFKDVFGNRRAVPTKKLRLTYQGEPVPYYVLPRAKRFGKGSVLYFLSRGESLNPYGKQAVFELAIDARGELMPVVKAEPAGAPVSFYEKTLLLEENHFFQGRLTTAPDIWLWDQLLAPVTKSYPFDVTNLAAVSESAWLKLWIQGTTDLAVEPDHHLRVYLNGTLLDDFTLEGELAWHGELELLPGLLHEGENSLEIENVGDTGAAYSRVMLSRFEVTYPRQTVVEGGWLEGTFDAAGVAEVSGILGDVVVVDTTEPSTRWLKQLELIDDTVRFAVEADHRYLVADATGVLAPEVRESLPVRLSSIQTGAQYLVIAPEALLEAAWPLLELRASQGLSSFGVATEQIFSEFGYGETRPEAIRDFLEHAYHHWGTPPRYVVLLGDGSFDFKDYFEWGVENQVPPYPLKTTYIWTASDPAYAAVNGDDLLPDIALGRLPAANLDEARVMVDKILAFEAEGAGLHGRAVLIADQSDAAGDFEQHAHDLAATLLNGHEVSKIFLSELGTAATHDAIVQAFDEGASLMSFIGHGGMQLWNHNILRNNDVDSLGLQAQQPLLFTMNCLNGYFQFPLFDSLAEALLKAEDKGVLAAFSPSGLSLDGPAHFYHRLLLTEILHGGHETLGDAILAAQGKYVDAGGYLELLRIYHLFGDPALQLAN